MREEVLYEVFLDLKKDYDALNWGICLEFLVAYRVRPWTNNLLHNYWEGLTMVSRAGCYYGAPFTGFRGVTQGYPLSPTIFNMVVDAVIYHWMTRADRNEMGPEGLRRVVPKLAALF